MTTYRIGHGYDIHKLCSGRKLVLGGVEISYEKGLDGHSDADVICHAVMDSLLGAAALGDIGGHFPNNVITYKDADSLKLLTRVKELIAENRYSIGNIDITVIAEAPKIAPHIPQMISNLSRSLGISTNDISIKATTNETLGFIGRGEGIAAFCVALLRK
jgi:2-C-methyl-D-erythritol 2,4-cyclodiphosphate synthase